MMINISHHELFNYDNLKNSGNKHTAITDEL